jgi:hypothetical protein
MLPSRVAIHEAGHAVVAVVLRRYFRRVSIVPYAKAARRVTGFTRVNHATERNRRREAVISAAGMAAEVLAGVDPRTPDELVGAAEDLENLRDLGYLDDERERQVFAEALDLVYENRDAILNVAWALDEHKSLKHSEIRGFVALSLP